MVKRRRVRWTNGGRVFDCGRVLDGASTRARRVCNADSASISPCASSALPLPVRPIPTQ